MPSANWRSPDDYAYPNELTGAELFLLFLAWEFLRRNPDYIRDYRRLLRSVSPEAAAALAAARRWGLPFPDGSKLASGYSAGARPAGRSVHRLLSLRAPSQAPSDRRFVFGKRTQ